MRKHTCLAAVTSLITAVLLAANVQVRAQTAGKLDTSFGAGGVVKSDFGGSPDIGSAIAVQPDGKIVIAGCQGFLACKLPDGNPQKIVIARYLNSGKLDTGFGSGGKVVTEAGDGASGAAALLLQEDGKIVVAGSTVTCLVPGPASNACGWGIFILRYLANGSPDRLFGVNGKVIASPVGFGVAALFGNTAALQPDGKIIVAGAVCNTRPFTAGCPYDFAVLRYLPSGVPDTSFGGDGLVISDFAGGTDLANAVVVQPDGKIVAGGFRDSGRTCTNVCLVHRDFALQRLTPNGIADPTFGTGGKVTTGFGAATVGDAMNGLALQIISGETRIVAAGSTSVWKCFPGFCRAVADVAVARYRPSGALDTTFASSGRSIWDLGGTDNLALGVVIDKAARIVLAGRTCVPSSSSCPNNFAVMRLTKAGSKDTAFGSSGATVINLGGDDRAHAIAIQPLDGRIVATGAGGTPEDLIVARYHN